MRILLTGATGFLGSWVVREMLGASHEVRVLVRPTSGAAELQQAGAQVCRGDVTSVASIRTAAEGVDAVVHCAGLVSLRPRDREALWRTNVEGTRNVLDAAASSGARVLHTSSIATVGPIAEPRVLDEGSPATPFVGYPYADSKRASETLAFEYARAGRDVVVLNPGITLGPGDPKFGSTQFVLHYLQGRLWAHPGGGASFGDVRDVARAYVTALERGRAGERYILAGFNHTYGELYAALRRITGLQPSATMPRPVAEWFGLWSEALAAVVPHPLEEINVPVVRWASLFNYCSSAKAEAELGYRSRNILSTLEDTVVDLIRRGAAPATTAELRALLGREPTTATERSSGDNPPKHRR